MVPSPEQGTSASTQSAGGKRHRPRIGNVEAHGRRHAQSARLLLDQAQPPGMDIHDLQDLPSPPQPLGKSTAFAARRSTQINDAHARLYIGKLHDEHGTDILNACPPALQHLLELLMEQLLCNDALCAVRRNPRRCPLGCQPARSNSSGELRCGLTRSVVGGRWFCACIRAIASSHPKRSHQRRAIQSG
jgi:hypothetical protein